MTNTAKDNYVADPIDAIADGDYGTLDDASDTDQTKGFIYSQVATYVGLKNGANFNAIPLTSTAASIAWNLATAQVAIHTMTENTTIAEPTNMISGATYTFRVTQHASAAKTLAYNSVFRPAANLPIISTALGAVDIMEFYCTGTTLELKNFVQNVGT